MSQQRLNTLSVAKKKKTDRTRQRPGLSWCGWGVFIKESDQKGDQDQDLVWYGGNPVWSKKKKKKKLRLHTVYYYLLYVYLYCRHCESDFVRWCTLVCHRLTTWYCRRRSPTTHIHAALILTNTTVWTERLEHGLAEPSLSSERSLPLGW